jgi:dGTP triphosphohydrolase
LQLRVDDSVSAQNKILRDLLWIYVVGSHHMATHQAGQAVVVKRLLKVHADAARDPSDEAVEIFPVDVREVLREAPNKVARLRAVADYVSAMTDPYAEKAHARLTGAGNPFYEYL